MQFLSIIGLLLAGLLLLIFGGRLLVDCAIWLGSVTGIPQFLMGATVLSFATTLPELLVSVVAAAAGAPGIAVGNAVGSVTVNMALVLGLSAAVAPLALSRRRFTIKGMLLLLACGILTLAGTKGVLGPGLGLLLVGVFAAFTAENLRQAKLEEAPASAAAPSVPDLPLWRRLGSFALAILCTLAGAQLMARYGSGLAAALGVADSAVGATIIALGTSIPELVTTIIALTRGQGAMSAGNVFGANVLDLAVVLPMCSLVTGGALQMPAAVARIDLPVCFAACLLVVVPSYISERVRRWQGLALLLLYAVYTAALLGGFGSSL